jgi:hypothetical protein
VSGKPFPDDRMAVVADTTAQAQASNSYADGSEG